MISGRTQIPRRPKVVFNCYPYLSSSPRVYRAILISFDALKAIAHGLGVIEGDLVKAQLMNLYHAKLEQTLIARGLFTLAKSLN